MTVVRIPLPRHFRDLAFIAEFYSLLHSWLLAWTGIFYFTRPLSECKGFYTPLDDQQCFYLLRWIHFTANSDLNRQSTFIDFKRLTLNKECLILNSHILLMVPPRVRHSATLLGYATPNFSPIRILPLEIQSTSNWFNLKG